MIFLFDDFGSADIYVGQVKSRLMRDAPGVPVLDLLHDAAAYDVAAAAHLLAALSTQLPAGSVVQAVVDPGVGGVRRALVVGADGRWFVGPDNGLLSVLVARALRSEVYEIVWRPDELSASFHGRDLFAPISAMLARGVHAADKLRPSAGLQVTEEAGDSPRIIYIDHYGNAMTGLRAGCIDSSAALEIGGTKLAYVRVFEAAGAGAPFWYVNSLGLVEIAVNRGNAAAQLKLAVGTEVRLVS